MFLFLDRIISLIWVIALWKNMDAILSAKYLKTIEARALKLYEKTGSDE